MQPSARHETVGSVVARVDARGAIRYSVVECICHGDTIRVKINGVTVNEAFDVRPSAGKVLLQSEGNEIYFRNVALYPLAADASPAGD